MNLFQVRSNFLQGLSDQVQTFTIQVRMPLEMESEAKS